MPARELIEIIRDRPIMKLLQPPVEPCSDTFQAEPGLGIKEGHAVQAAAARNELTLLADDIVVNADDFAAFKTFTGRRYRFFCFMCRQDAGTFAAVTE